MAKSKALMSVGKAAPKKLDELGATGLKRPGPWGVLTEEFLPDLAGERARKVYREMADNDPTVGSVLFAIAMLIRNVDWRVDGDNEELVEFVDSCLGDMSHTWTDFLTEVLSMLPFGFSWHEIVYKRRDGESDDPTKRSRYSDGKIGWRKLPIRSQDSLSEWGWDEDGGIRTFVQIAPPRYQRVDIPIERSLLFRFASHKDNPEGRSILRSAYRSWYFKKRIEDIEGVGIERDLAGIPVIYRSAELASQDAEFKKILRNIRRDEQEGLLLPMVYDENGKELLRFELMSSPGQRQINITQVIDRYDKRIAMTVLADFILLGQQSVGSFALASSKTELFATAIGAVLKSIAEVMNRYAIPRLLAVNGIAPKGPKGMPQLVPGDLETPDLQQLGAWITALAGAGAPLFPDDELENHLRKISNLPLKSEGKGIAPPPALPSQSEASVPRPAAPKPAVAKPAPKGKNNQNLTENEGTS